MKGVNCNYKGERDCYKYKYPHLPILFFPQIDNGRTLGCDCERLKWHSKRKKTIKSSSQRESRRRTPPEHRKILPRFLRFCLRSLLRFSRGFPLNPSYNLGLFAKLWRSLISDPHFVKSHLNLSTRNNQYPRHRLIFSTVPRVNLKSCDPYRVLYDKSVDAAELDYPLKHPHKAVWIAGSCNGLLCIAIEEDILFIGNPATRRWNRLPYCGVKMRSGWYVLYGFGYVESTDDYKVVGIFCVFKSGGRYDTEVKIYSLKAGNWKRIGEFPHGIPLDDSGKFLNGSLHWAASQDFGSSYSWIIVSLDLEKETYGEVSQPVYDEGDFDLTLGVLGKWLCVLCNYRGNHADVWVMKV